jgi:N-formylglutamate amidohydrolase
MRGIKIKDLTSPIIVAAIHSGHTIREELSKLLIIKESDRFREEDPYTDRWLTISNNIISPVNSRYEVDLNRRIERSVYRSLEDSWGVQVWKESVPNQILQKSLEKHSEFYSKLESDIDKLLRYQKYIIVYDLHAYNYKRNGPDKMSEDEILNPEINLGTATMNRERWSSIVDRFIDDVRGYNFKGLNLDIRENIKFRGGYFPYWLHTKYPNSVCCLSIALKNFS